MPTIRLLWVEGAHALQGWNMDAGQDVLDAGRLHVAPGEFRGPAGEYRMLSAEACFAMHPEATVPLLLHESYEAHMEKWVNNLPDGSMEPMIVGRVRDAVMQMCDSRLATDPDAFTPMPVVTSTEPSLSGATVVGRCVVFRPA